MYKRKALFSYTCTKKLSVMSSCFHPKLFSFIASQAVFCNAFIAHVTMKMYWPALIKCPLTYKHCRVHFHFNQSRLVMSSSKWREIQMRDSLKQRESLFQATHPKLRWERCCRRCISDVIFGGGDAQEVNVFGSGRMREWIAEGERLLHLLLPDLLLPLQSLIWRKESSIITRAKINVSLKLQAKVAQISFWENNHWISAVQFSFTLQ